MGRGPVKDNQNVYFRARKRAALGDERLYVRERAAEMLGISAYTLADYELGNVKVVPIDKVVLMADLYGAPELITGYCKHECPVHGFLPLATEVKGIQGITLRLLKGLNEDDLRQMKETLIDITEDGDISRDEVDSMRKIVKNLEGIAEVISEMKLVAEKYLSERSGRR